MIFLKPTKLTGRPTRLQAWSFNRHTIYFWCLFFTLVPASLAQAQEDNGHNYVKKVRVAVCEATEVHR